MAWYGKCAWEVCLIRSARGHRFTPACNEVCYEEANHMQSHVITCKLRTRLNAITCNPHSVHTRCSHTVFTHGVHTRCSHTVFTHGVHTRCSHTVFTHGVHTRCPHTVSTHGVHTRCSNMEFTHEFARVCCSHLLRELRRRIAHEETPDSRTDTDLIGEILRDL